MDKEFAEAFKEEIELDEMKWAVGGVYHQEFKNGDKVYFRADSVQKNKRWKGLSVDEFGGRQKKAKNASADEKQQGWETTPKNEIPKGLKEEVEKRWTGGKLPPHLAKFFDKDGNLKKDAADRIAKGRAKLNWKDVTPKGYGPKEEVEEASTYRDKTKDDEKKKKRHFAFGGKKKSRHGESGYGKGEEVEVDEKKSATGYELYHKDFSSAMQHAYKFAKSKGHVIDPKEIDDKVATGPKKPSSGKTNRYSLKAGRKKVEIQVTNLDNKRYELNMYIEGVVLESTEEYAKSLEKIARDRQISILSKSDKTTLLKIAALLDKEKKEDVEIDEAEIATSIGSGGTAGLDMGLTYKKKKEDVKKAKALRKQMVGESVQRTTFAGKDVFIVDSETYYNCRLGKKKYGRYEKYVGKGKVGQTIREYGLKYPRRPIILQNGESGPMLFLKYGRS